MSAVESGYNLIQSDQDRLNENGQSVQDPPVEVVIPEVYTNYGADASREAFGSIWSRTLRIKVTGNDGSNKLDVRIPVSHMNFLFILSRVTKFFTLVYTVFQRARTNLCSISI